MRTPDRAGIVAAEEAFDAVANDILEAVERDDAGEWIMPWAGFAARPTNAFSGRAFRGQNTLSLWAGARKRGFTTHLWASPESWESKGGTIRAGETGTLILVPIFDDDAPGRRWNADTAGVARKVGPLGGDALGGEMRPMLGFSREYWFNIHQVDGIAIAAPQTPTPTEAAQALERALLSWAPRRGDRTSGPAVQEGGLRAFWNPATDRVRMPPKAAFQSRDGITGDEYYALTLGHEFCHATGSSGRLARETLLNYGTGGNRPKEELVAEIGAAFLSSRFGLPAQLMTHNKAYVTSWMKQLGDRSRRKSLFWAVGRAEEACAYILARAADGTFQRDAG